MTKEIRVGSEKTIYTFIVHRQVLGSNESVTYTSSFIAKKIMSELIRILGLTRNVMSSTVHMKTIESLQRN